MVNNSERSIIIVGAGIIGLTTAVRLLESLQQIGLETPVHILADHLPNDPIDAKYASTIAGAHHLSFADDNDARQQKWDKTTFAVMWDEWLQLGESSGLMALTQTELFVGVKNHLKIYESHPEFSVVADSSRPQGVDHAVKFTSITMTPLVYLNRLLSKFYKLSKGQLRLHRYHLASIRDLNDPAVIALVGDMTPAAIIICAGLGARTLGGVEDESVFPTRGQVVKVRAPWIRSGFTRQIGDLSGGEGGERTYVIPRPDGEVILGGTREVNDWYPYARAATSADILRRAVEICPDLLPPNVRRHILAPSCILAERASTTIPDDRRIKSSPLDEIVMESMVGFRPSRKGGICLMRSADLVCVDDLKTAVIYNYGHGGAGWQCCWGTAEEAVKLTLETL